MEAAVILPPRMLAGSGPKRPLAATAACAAVLAVFAAFAWRAVSTKSPTYDEPLHAVAAWSIRHAGDFRVDVQHLPLPLRWAALGIPAGALRPDLSGPGWSRLLSDPESWRSWVTGAVYRTPGSDPDLLIGRARAMMLPLSLATGAMIAWWAYRLGGPLAAFAATLPFALDPTCLAHAALVKDDFSAALAGVALVGCVWRTGLAIRPWSLLLLPLAFGAVATVKLSALLFALSGATLLLLRALAPQPWPMFDRLLATRGRRLLAASGLLLWSTTVSIVAIWACYDFRFTPAPAEAFDPQRFAGLTEAWELEGPGLASAASPPGVVGLTTQLVLGAERRRLMPQAWLMGLLVYPAVARAWPSYLLGEVSTGGWWYYLPLAALVKTPLSTLALIVVAAALGRPGPAPPGDGGRRRWALACLLVPVVLYLAVAMQSRVQIGIRHLLPLYPFAAVGLGVALARAARTRYGRVVVPVLFAALAVESVTAFPHYLSFFNAAVGGSRGGLRLLGGSNLDWGQDLPLLARWQREHPDEKLYLCYHGTGDPAHYGIRYANLPGGYPDGPPAERPREPGVVAVSATALQGIYFPPALRAFYSRLPAREPLEVLGGSIYLYRYPADGAPAGPTAR